MNVIHYIGLDLHKKTISYCIKTADGRTVREGKLQALRATLRSWAEDLREPWCGAMEATLFSAWIYDTLKPYAQRLVMGHPARMEWETWGETWGQIERMGKPGDRGNLGTDRTYC